MRKRDLVDLDDLLALPVMLLAGDPALAARYRERFGFVAVDEYQDVDELQYRLLRLLTTPEANLCVIGDPDQAIYGFEARTSATSSASPRTSRPPPPSG